MTSKHPIKRRCGFRFSPIDAAVLLVATIVAIWMHRHEYELWWVVPMAVGHFFLFCYHGILARKHNPRLAEYLAARNRTPV